MPLIQGFEELNLNVALLGSANVFGIALQESKLRDGVESVSTGYLLVVVLLTKICFFPRYCSPSFGACVRLEPLSFMCLLLPPAWLAEVVAGIDLFFH